MSKRLEKWIERNGLRRVGYATTCLVALIVLACSGTDGRAAWPGSRLAAHSVPVVHASTDLRQGDLEDVLMTIRDDGFDPSEITRVPGKFLLSVDDRRNDKTQRLTLRLSREGGEHLRDIEVPEKATDWAEEVELQAGRYVLTEVSHSNWTCRITVQ